MKTLLALCLAVSTSAFAQGGKALTQTYAIDTTATTVVWVGKKVTGQHTGNLSVKSGSLTFLGEEITAGDVVVDMKSLTTTDITDKEMNAKFIGHMTSPDFFDVAKYPESKLVIKSSKKTAKGLEVTGDLTMIGQTRPVTFLATDVKKSDKEVTANANITLNRTLWGLKYGSGSFFKGLGDKAINDDFTLNISIKATK